MKVVKSAIKPNSARIARSLMRFWFRVYPLFLSYVSAKTQRIIFSPQTNDTHDVNEVNNDSNFQNE